MRLIKPYAVILNISHPAPSRSIDFYGRTCYKSEPSHDPVVWSQFVQRLIKNKHLSVIEHASVTVRIVCDRGVSHELVRHRIASYSQESTRYCNYKDDHITFIIPCWLEDMEEGVYVSNDYILKDHTFYGHYTWMDQMMLSEQGYKSLISNGWTPQQARSVLPNSLKTELIMTANLREWRTIFELRCAKAAHPQMREIMLPLLQEFAYAMPDFFSDLNAQFNGGSDERKETKGLD
jgi:thymidylate synthase (FAD)